MYSCYQHKFGENERGWRPGVVRDSSGVGVWKETKKQWELFNSMISFMVGNGRRVKFWKDRWCIEEPLCEAFRSLFALSDSKEAWVANLWEHRGESDNWNFCFVRNLNDWELGAMEYFLSLLHGHLLKREQEDKVVWKGENKGAFSAKGLYSVLESDCTILFPLKIVWNPWIPSKVSFFTWEACWGNVWLWISFKKEDGFWPAGVFYAKWS